MTLRYEDGFAMKVRETTQSIKFLQASRPKGHPQNPSKKLSEVPHTCSPLLWRQTGRFLLARNMSLLDELQARRKPCLPQKEGRWHLRNDTRGPFLASTQTSAHRANAHTKKNKRKEEKDIP